MNSQARTALFAFIPWSVHVGKVGIRILAVVMSVVATTAPAQNYVAPRPAAQNNIVRGQGQFLSGMAWYDLYTARAMAINVEAARQLDQWNRDVYDAYMRERAARLRRRSNLTRAQAKAAQQKYEEREKRLRTSPSVEEISNGDALNALLIDLSDPAIGSSSWRFARVPLPADISIRSLAFQFAPKPGARGSQELSRSLIALGRLDAEGRWPPYLASDKLKAERASYEAAYRTIRVRSVAGRLGIDEVQALDGELEKLQARAAASVPVDRGFRASALNYVRGMKDATRLFDAETIGFAQEMIADTSGHEAGTVGELLAFMRKYRLLFPAADKMPGGDAMYPRLYALMREQKEKLGGAAGQRPTGEESDQLEGTWTIVSTNAKDASIPIKKGDDFTITFEGGAKAHSTRNGTTFFIGRYEIDPSKTPKEIDMVFTEGWKKGGKTCGIYEIQNEKLNICLNFLDPGARPRDFSLPATVYTFVRKGSGDERVSPPASDHAQKLQGTWLITWAVIDGRNMPGIRRENRTVQFQGDSFTMKIGGKTVTSGRWSIDATKSPMEYNEYPSDGVMAGKVKTYIFERDGEDLLCCSGTPRPDRLESQPGQKRQLSRLSRVGP